VNRRLALELNGLVHPYPSPAGSHPMTGERAPDLELQTANGLARIGELLRNQEFLLIDCTGNQAYDDLSLSGAPVRSVSGIPTGLPPSLHGVQSMLVRPDAYLAWVDSGVPEPQRAREELAQWLDLLG